MTDPSAQSRLSLLPSVDEILRSQAGQGWLAGFPRSLVLSAVRGAVEKARRAILEGAVEAPPSETTIERDAERILKEISRPHLRRVINATGVILHTNLGRAPLAREAMTHAVEISEGYSNLEFDLERGVRGKRYSHVVGLIRETTGAEDAVVVNNNAAAVLLCLTALAAEREVVVSRGELIEIGGAFRVPDVMRAGGAILKEVGTTNRTHLKDYEGAISENTALLLKVHPSNYRVVGFVHEPPIEEIVRLGRSRDIPVMFDLGSGSLLDLARFGIPGEPPVRKIIEAGTDVVTWSGDKLLGGPQAGIIAGRSEIIRKVQAHPLTRAVRVDKMTLAALEATLMIYRDPEDALKKIPVLRMLTEPLDSLKRRATLLAGRLRKRIGGKASVTVVTEKSQAGGGSLPEVDIETFAVAVRPAGISASLLEERLRKSEQPVIVRLREDAVLLDVRTIAEREVPEAAIAVAAAIEDRP